MTRGLLTAFCLSCVTGLVPFPATAQDRDLSVLADWADAIGAIVRTLEDRSDIPFRLFNPDRLHSAPEDRVVEGAAWEPPLTTKSSAHKPGLSAFADGGGLGLALRF